MKLLSIVSLMICIAGPWAAPIFAQVTASEDTIREFHGAVAVGDVRRVKEMLAGDPTLRSAPFPEADPAKRVAPILTAVEYGQTKMVQILLDHGASYNTGKPGGTPLFRAALLGQTDILRLLLNAGAGIDGPEPQLDGLSDNNLKAVTPLRAALCCSKLETARFLVAQGAQVDIFSAAGLGWNGWVAKQIKEIPQQATMSDAWNFKPLTYAVACGSAGTAEILISNGADINEVSPIDHGTFLHLAAENGYGDLINVMLAHGVNINVKNDKGNTALDLAERFKQDDAAQTLRDHGAKHGNEM